jgi:anti-sigma factor RsiW
MLTCRLFQKDLSSYLDGELPAARAARLEAHLRLCQHCRNEVAALQGITDRIRAVSRNLTVSRDFDQRVLRAVGYYRVTTARRERKPLTKPLVVLALILLALLGMIRHFFSRQQPLPLTAPVPAVSGFAPAPHSAPPVPGRDQR